MEPTDNHKANPQSSRTARQQARLRALQQATSGGQGDTFAWYALAMEYRSLGRVDEALETLESLRERDATYVPMYLMAAELYAAQGNRAKALQWIEQGSDQAQAARQRHAYDKLQALRCTLG